MSNKTRPLGLITQTTPISTYRILENRLLINVLTRISPVLCYPSGECLPKLLQQVQHRIHRELCKMQFRPIEEAIARTA